MAGMKDDHAQAAMQYLIWALEQIEKTENWTAAEHVRSALDELGKKRTGVPDRRFEQAKRFRDKAVEAEQLIPLAKTEARRASLAKIAESYRMLAEQRGGAVEPHPTARKRQ